MERTYPRLARASELSLQFLIVAAAVAVVVYALVAVRLVVLPVVVALFITAVLSGPARWLERRGLPPSLAAFGALAGGIALLAGVVAAIVPTVAGELDELGTSLEDGINEVVRWLAEGPLGVSQAELDRAVDRVGADLVGTGGSIASGVITGATLIGELIAGLLLALVVAFFFIREGDRMYAWLVSLAPARFQEPALEVGARAWQTFGGYIRGVTVIALVDAVLIGIALLIIGVPLVLPLALLVFFGAYLPLVGAVLAGLAAALVALVAEGPVSALLVVGAVTLIQQIEGDLLYPIVVGRTVQLHPVAVLLALTAGVVLGGVVGAILAVPLAAVGWVVVEFLRERPQARGDPEGALPARRLSARATER